MRTLGKAVVTRAGKALLVAGVLLSLELSLSTRLAAPITVHAQAAPPQDDLPDGLNKTLVVSKCTRCHSSQVFASHHQSSSAWDETISKMQTKGLTLSDEEYDKVLTYLSTYLGPPPATITGDISASRGLPHLTPESSGLKHWLTTIP